jgi:uncharacterized small protein (DUF1192 family)
MQAAYPEDTAMQHPRTVRARQFATVIAIASAAALTTPAAQAQIYKCTVAGKTVFSDQPCDADAKPLDVRPASGRGADQRLSSDGTPINASSNPQELLSRMERDRRIRDLEHEIRARRSRISDEQSAMDREIAALRQQKTRANNNLAGATWEKSISEEMSAVVGRYDVRIRTLQDEINRLENDLNAMRK